MVVIFGYNGRDGVVTDNNGLYYMRARYYSPDMRRFVNADIVAGQISNAVTMNRFAYANGNPVSFVDPFGLSAERGSAFSDKEELIKNIFIGAAALAVVWLAIMHSGTADQSPPSEDVSENPEIYDYTFSYRSGCVSWEGSGRVFFYITKKLLTLQEKRIKENSVLSRLEKEQRQNKTAISNIMAAVEQGLYTSAAGKRMRELEERQAELERLIILERSKMQIKVSADEIRRFYTQALSLEPMMLITYLVKDITVCKDAIHIRFNTPIQQSPDESQGFSICDKKVVIPVYTPKGADIQRKSIRLTATV